MKRKVILMGLLASIGLMANAQKGINIEAFVQPGLSFGGEYDVPSDNSTYSTYVALPKKSTLGLIAGASFGYYFTNKVGASVGLGYAHQGQNYDKETYIDQYGNAHSFTKSVSLNYLKVPFQFHFVTSSDKAISFALGAGFYFGYLLSYTDETKTESSIGAITTKASGSHITTTVSGSNSPYFPNSSSSGTFSNGKPFWPIDFGLAIGAGLQFRVSDKISIPLMLNLQQGITNVKNRICYYTDSKGSTNDYWDDQIQQAITYRFLIAIL